MEADQFAGGRESEERLAAMRHRHLNQIQNMISLAGLFGRRMPDPSCRDAFADLRARFEALAFLATAIPDDENSVELNLPALAERLTDILDPERTRRISVSGRSVRASLHCAEGLCQVLAEMTIALVRQGLPADDGGGADSGAAGIDVSAGEDGVLVISAHSTSVSARATLETNDLGWSIGRSVAQNLNGSLELLSTSPLVMEARIPISSGPR